MAFLGPNGAGKSATSKMVSGILHPSGGTLKVDGLVPYQQPIANAQKIAVVLGQGPPFLWDLTVTDSFTLVRYATNVPPFLGLAFFGLSMLVWNRGQGRYQSTGS